MSAGGRVLFVSQHSNIIGGGEISLLTLLQGLAATEWKTSLIVPEEGAVAEQARSLDVNVRISPLPSLRRPRPALLGAVRGVRRLGRELGPDIVHANGTRAMFYGGLAARAAGCLSIWHIRIVDLDPRFDAVLVRLADAFVATSEAARARLRHWPEAFEQCRVVPNGIDLDSFAARRERAAMRSELGLASDDLVVIAVGRLVDFKRTDVLLEAIARIRGRLPAIKCVVVGSGPAEEWLRQRAADEDLDGSVIFTGHRDDVADLLGASDIFVLTSPRESFGRVVIEAMAVALPVIAADAGGPAEIVEHDRTGLLVEPDSVAALAAAIIELAGDSARRSRMGAAGRRAAEQHYSLQAHTAEIVEIYDELIGEETRR